MIDNNTDLSELSDEELSSSLNGLSSALSNYQMLLWNCFNEQERRLTRRINTLQRIVVRDICNDDNNFLTSNASENTNECKDCHGRPIQTDDLVEVLTPSKSGKPFNSNEIALVRYGTGNCVRLSKLENKSIQGFRDSKNVRLIE